MTTRLYATFTIDDVLFGIDTENVQEVLLPQHLTEVPLAAPEVSGLMNLRGQVVVTVDMRKRLGFPERDADLAPINIVLRTEDGPLSVLVDDVGDVFEARDDDLEPPPETLSEPTKNHVVAVHKLADRLLLVLDVHKTAKPSSN